MEKWDRILSAENVLVGLRAKRNMAAIRELAGVLEGDEAILDHKSFLADIIRREQQASTGIGHGVALPHAHEDSILRQVLAVGISKDGVDFGAADGAPVQILALLATPKKHHKKHMELLASLSRLLQHEDVRQGLIEAADAAQVIEVFRAGK